MNRRFAQITGLSLLALLWLGPLPAWATSSFSAHMTLHMGVVAVAAPLVAVGLAGSGYDLADRFPRLFAPIPASIVELVVVWSWHVPALHHLARHTIGGLLLEQGSFLACGFLVWMACLGGFRGGGRSALGIAALLITSMHMTLLGALLALAPRPLYVHGDSSGTLTALQDQQLGGAIMLIIGGVAYLSGGLWLGVGLLRSRASSISGAGAS